MRPSILPKFAPCQLSAHETLRLPAAAANPEDIELDEPGEDEEDGDADGDAGAGPSVVQQAVPDAVFGSVAAAAAGAAEDSVGDGGAAAEKLGALDRFKRAKTSDA